MVLVLLLQMQERLLGLLQDVFPPCEQLQAEIVPLALVHERLLVGRQIRLGFSSGQHPTHSLTSFVLGATICPRAADLYLSLIHISEPTRQAEISYAVFC